MNPLVKWTGKNSNKTARGYRTRYDVTLLVVQYIINLILGLHQLLAHCQTVVPPLLWLPAFVE